jgi:hypothetical protein
MQKPQLSGLQGVVMSDYKLWACLVLVAIFAYWLGLNRKE